MKTPLKTKSAFTILELALAMAFLSFLLLGIGLVTIQMAQIFQKGVTIKSVNATGRELVDEFTRTLSSTSYTPPESDDFAEIYTQTTASLVSGENETTTVPVHGAFCAGRYSYIWNTGYALNLENELEIENYRAVLVGYNDDPDAEPLRLLRVDDPSRTICRNHQISRNNEYTGSISNPTELLASSDTELALYDFVAFEPTYHDHTGHALFTASFILGTLSGGIDITLQENFCTDLPDGFNTDFTYCSVNKFNFTARATGGT